MSAMPDALTLMGGLRDALVAIERELTPGVNAYGHFVQNQDVLPYWTNNVSTARFEDIGGPMQRAYIGVACYYHVSKVAGGIKGEHEERAQVLLIEFSAEFLGRPLLQSAEFPRGARSVETITVLPSALRIVDIGGVAMTRAVVINLEVPLLVRINRRYP